MGGQKKHPTSTRKCPRESPGMPKRVQVVYDPAKLSYEGGCSTRFWLNHDPTVTNRQFCDAGSQ